MSEFTSAHPTTARAFWVVDKHKGEIRSEPLAPPTADQVTVRTDYTAISRGTESLVFRNDVPPSQHAAMRAPNQCGEFPAPVKYGYSNVGTIITGEDTGRRVFCLYPHQDVYVIERSVLIDLPDDVPSARAVLAANMETALNGLWDANVRPGDRVTVIGAGAVGCLAAWLAGRIPGCEVQLLDRNPARESVARHLGVDFATPERAATERDLVIHASGSPDGLALGLQLAGFEATVLELSWFGDRTVALPLGEAFHSRRLRLVSSQVGTVAPAQRVRWSHARRLATAVGLLADPQLDVLISDECAFDQLPERLAAMAGSSGDELCVRVRYP